MANQRKEYEMLFALEAQLGREFRATFERARGELGETAESAESFGDRTTQAVDAVSGALTAIGVASILREIQEGFEECTQASMDFESAITGVAKTTDLSETELADMRDAIMDMSTRIPATTEEIAGVAEAAGQLGIQKDALLDFTETMTMLGTATNMTAEDAATALARFANITGMSADNYGRLGSVIVDLGNNFATTESEITQMGTRLASGGKLAGLTEPQIMALAAAMSSVGIEAEAGGTAMTQTLNAIEKSVAIGGDSLTEFARISGMSAEQFTAAWNDDALSALTAFIRGLGDLDSQGESAVLVLEDLGLTGIRQSNMLKSLALAADQMDSAVQTANIAWDENTALMNEASKRYATTQSKLDMTQNAVNNLKVAVGDAFTPELGKLYDMETNVLKDVTEYVKQSPAILKGIATFTALVGGATAALTAYAAISKVIKALDMASMFGGAVGPIMLGVTAVAALTAGIVTLAEASKHDVVPTVSELTEAARELDSAMSAAKAACDTTITTTEASANAASIYIDRLDELNALGELSTEQQQEYHGILIKLVETIPELSDCIDLENDVINGGTEALRANTQAWKDNAIAQAYQEQLTELYSKNADVMIEAEKNKIGLRDAEAKLVVAQKAQNDEFERQNKLYQDASQKVTDYYNETGLTTDMTNWLGETVGDLNLKLERNAQAVDAAQREVDNYKQAIEDGNASLQEAQAEIDLAEEAVRNLTSTTGEAVDTTEDAARGNDDLSATIGNVKERVEELTSAYVDSYNSAYQSIHGQYSLWSEVDKTVATSTSTINDSLAAQITHWQDYNANLAALKERAGDIDGLSSVIGSFADGSADSVNAIAGMAAASDDDLKKMVKQWKELQEEQTKTSESVADFQSHFTETMDAIKADLEDDVAAMDLGAEAMASGQATIQGFLDGATSMLPLVQSAYQQIGQAALSGLYWNRLSGHKKSSRVSGGMVEQAYADGTTSAEAGLALVGEEGPELVMMRGGETVINAGRTKDAMSAMVTGYSSGNVQVVFNIENVDEAQMNRLEAYGDEFAERVMAVVRDADEESRRGRYA